MPGISSISPFAYESANNLQRYFVNHACLKEIAADIGKPLRRNDSPLEYLPTQVIAEFIKSQNYDGVQYASTMTKDGYNLAIFDDSLFACVDTHVYEIIEVVYRPQEVL